MRSITLPGIIGRFLVVASLTTMAAACGSDSAGPSDSNHSQEPSDDGETRLRMTNESSTSAWYVYIRRCGEADWGPDRLGSSNVLSPGESTSWTTNTPGCVDVQAFSEPGSGQRTATYFGVDIAAEQTTQLKIRKGDWQ